MSSRLTLRILSGSIAAALVLAGGGCSLRQSPPQSSDFDINAASVGCLDHAHSELENYLEGKASAQDIDNLWSCAENTLNTFVKKVVGSEAGSYSADELSTFLARYFIHSVPLTPGLISQVGTLKTLMVGGSPDRISVDEIHRLRGFFEVLRLQSQNLRPFMPISRAGIGGMPWSRIDRSYLDRFSATLTSAAQAIGASLNANGTPYTFAQFDALIEAFLNALPANAGFDGTIGTLSSIHEHLGLIQAVKNTFLVPGSASVSTGSDWQDLLVSAANWGNLAVRAAWLTDSERMAESQEHLDQGAGLAGVGMIFDRAQGLLLGVTRKHPGQVITFEELDQLVQQIPAADLPVPAKDIEFSMRPIVRRLIGGADLDGPDGRQALGITPGNLAKLSEIFHNWYEGQRFLETLFSEVEQHEGDQAGSDYLRDTLLNSPVASDLWDQVLQPASPQWNAETKLAAERIRKLIAPVGAAYAGLRPLFAGVDNEITFQRYDEGLRYSFHDLAAMNWMQNLSRLLVRGYATKDDGEPQGNPVRADTDDWQPGSGTMVGAGVTLDEFKQAFADFKPLGVDLKFFNPNSPNSAFDRFREGDVFTYVSDGNGYLDMNEAATLLAFAVSTKRKADRIQSDIALRCKTQVLDTVYGKPLIDYSCYSKWFYGQVQDYWDKMDELVHYFGTLSDGDKAEFQQLLETSARQGGYTRNAMSIDDTENLVATLQYIEAIFSRYDVGDDGYLSPDEAQTAFPVFKRVLEQMGQTMNPPVELDDDSANLIFTYMLDKGVLPGGACSVIWWDIVKHLPLMGNFKADRLRILEVFAALAESGTKLNAPSK